MAGTQHAFDYLATDATTPLPGMVVLFGDEDFLSRLVQVRVAGHLAAGDDAREVATTHFSGEEAAWNDVADELSTRSLFGGGGRRLVVVDAADKFVTKFRDKLEGYAERPKKSGVLLLEVESWASNTRLYKLVDQRGLQVDCRLPLKGAGKSVDLSRVQDWLVDWGKSRHHVHLQPTAAKLLCELVGTNLGLLDQDLAKLALYVEGQQKITPDLVRDIVGGWQVKTVWELVDAAADGNTAEALRQLDLALQAGTAPIGLFAQVAWSLRRYAVAASLFLAAERRGENLPLKEAAKQAGFREWPPGALANAERQLKRLGRDRSRKLLRWLLDADLAMKGSHSAPVASRMVLEQLLFRLANFREGTPASAPTRVPAASSR